MANQGDEYWRKKLVLKKIPDDWSHDLIQNFLEVVTGGAEVEEDGVEYFGDIKHTALVTFADPLSEECVAKAQEQTTKKKKSLLLELIKDGPTSILVRDLDPSLTQDNLFYYFDSPRSGGTEGTVLEDGCELFTDLNMALVTFSSSDVAQKVLATQEHSPCRGIRVQVEPCYDEFHKPLLEELKQRTTNLHTPPEKAAAVHHTQSAPVLSGASQRRYQETDRQNVELMARPRAPPKPYMPPKPPVRPQAPHRWNSLEHDRAGNDFQQSPDDYETDYTYQQGMHDEYVTDYTYQQGMHDEYEPGRTNARLRGFRSQSMDSFDPNYHSDFYHQDFDTYESDRPYMAGNRGHRRVWRGGKSDVEPFTLFPPRPSSGDTSGDHGYGRGCNYRGRRRSRGRRPSPHRSRGRRGRGNFFDQTTPQNYQGQGRRGKPARGSTPRSAEIEELFTFGEAHGSHGNFSAQSPPVRPQRVIRLDAECNPIHPEFSSDDIEVDGRGYHNRFSGSDSSGVEDFTQAPSHKVPFSGKPREKFYLHQDSGDYTDESYNDEEDSFERPVKSKAASRNRNSYDADYPDDDSVFTGRAPRAASDREKRLQEELRKVRMEKERLERERETLRQQKETQAGDDSVKQSESQPRGRSRSPDDADDQDDGSVAARQAAQEALERQKQLEEELLQLKREKEELEKEKDKMKQQKLVTDRMPVQPYKLRVLKEFARDFKVCELTLLEQEGMILFHGTEEECVDARCIFLTQIQDLPEDSLSDVPPEIATILKTTRGQKYLSELSQVYGRCSVEVEDSCVRCVGHTMMEVNNVLQDIKNNIRQETLKVPTALSSSSELLALKTHLESELLVLLTLPADGSSRLLIHGMNGDVDIAKREVQEHIDTNKPGLHVFRVPGALAGQAIQEWFSLQLEKAKALIQKNGEVMGTDVSADSGFAMTYQCRQEVLQEVNDTLKKIDITSKTFDLHATFTSYSERALVINGLHNSGVDPFCVALKQTLAKQHRVSAIVTIKLPPKCQLPKLRYDTQRPKHQSRAKPPVAKVVPVPRRRSSGQFHTYNTIVGNTTITIKTGDISKEQVQVLVSIVGEDLNMKGTAVGSSILKRFPNTGQDLQSQQPGQGIGVQVIQGQLPAAATPLHAARAQLAGLTPVRAQTPWVLHTVLKKMTAPVLTNAVQQLTQQCLMLAIRSGKTSIAFPPLGVGRKFGFPVDAVADAMTSTVVQLVQRSPGSLQKVVFVIYDMDTAKKFKVALKQRVPNTSGAVRAVFPVAIQSDDSQSDDDEAVSDDDYVLGGIGAGGGANNGSSSGSDDDDVLTFTDVPDDSPQVLAGILRPSSSRTKFEALVCTRSSGEMQAVKDELLKQLKSTFLWMDTVRDLSAFKKLGTKAMDDIQTAAIKGNVVLRVSEKDGKVTACGQKAEVVQVVSFIKDKIMSQEKKDTSGGRKHRHRVPGLPGDTHHIPSYWKICQKGVFRDIAEAIRNMKKHGALHDVDNAEQKAIEQLIQDTWMPQFIGHGKDGVGLSHRNVKVVKIERLENPELWEKYSMLRESCVRRLEFNKQSGFTPVEKLPGSTGPVRTTQMVGKGNALRREIYPMQVNEHYLFHGTKKEFIDGIVKDGLDSRISGANSMLGRGIYASESATKADQYTDDKRQRTSGKKTLLLVRMLLGQPYINKAGNPVKYDRPPCSKCGKDKCTGCAAKRYDSVIDDAGRNFREFVVYDGSLCYPEYFITYVRV